MRLEGFTVPCIKEKQYFLIFWATSFRFVSTVATVRTSAEGQPAAANAQAGNLLMHRERRTF